MRRGTTQTHLRRYREIASILAEEGLGALAVALGLPEALKSHAQPDETSPERVRHALERIGPIAVKVGQMLSTRPDLVPEEYRVELARLQDQVAPIPFAEVSSVIQSELGDTPERVFARFDEVPIASASIGQVHSAQLPSGEEVAVKVQRPGILHRSEIDLELMVDQARRIAKTNVGAGLDIAKIAEEFAAAVRKELDYLTEAEHAQEFGRVLAQSKTVVIPRVFSAYCTRKVLTLERLEGIAFNRKDLLDEARVDRHLLAWHGVQAYLTQIFDIGLFHADPHPGNLFALPDNKVGFTDFGRVGIVSRGVGDTAADLLLGIVDRDADLAAEALMSIASEPGHVDFEALRQDVSVLVGKYYGVELGHIRVGQVLNDLLELVRTHRLSLPSDFAMMMATLGELEGVGADLDPNFDFVEVAKPYAEKLSRMQYSPEQLTAGVLRTSRRWARAATELPSVVERALRRVAEGEFRIAVRPEGFEHLLDRAEELVDRIALAVIVAAFVLAFSRLLSIQWISGLIRVLLVVGMVGAMAVGGWIFISVFIARLRGRNPS